MVLSEFSEWFLRATVQDEHPGGSLEDHLSHLDERSHLTWHTYHQGVWDEMAWLYGSKILPVIYSLLVMLLVRMVLPFYMQLGLPGASSLAVTLRSITHVMLWSFLGFLVTSLAYTSTVFYLDWFRETNGEIGNAFGPLTLEVFLSMSFTGGATLSFIRQCYNYHMDCSFD